MAIIVIKDLSENIDLDRQAMLAIAGGSRFRTGSRFVQPVSQRVRLFDPARIGSTKPHTKDPAPR